MRLDWSHVDNGEGCQWWEAHVCADVWVEVGFKDGMHVPRLVSDFSDSATGPWTWTHEYAVETAEEMAIGYLMQRAQEFEALAMERTA